MRISFYLLLIVVVSHEASPSIAQTVDTTLFSPLTTGNRWEFSVEDISQTPDIPPALLTYEVLGDTIISGEQTKIILYEGYNLEAQMEETALCIGFFSACHRVPLVYSFYPQRNYIISQDDENGIAISGIEYPFNFTATSSDNGFFTGGAGLFLTYYYAEGIGLYRHSYFEIHHLNDNKENTQWNAYLSYAKIGDNHYGISSVGVDDEIGDLPRSEAVEIYPNPFREGVQISIASISQLRIETYDNLGRLLSQQELDSRTFVSSEQLGISVPGLYHLRIRTDSGEVFWKTVLKNGR